MESFAWVDGKIRQSSTKEGIPLHQMKDCLINKFELHPKEEVIDFGILIKQLDTNVYGTFHDQKHYFSFTCEMPLSKWHIDDQTCFAQNEQNAIHMFSLESNHTRTINLPHPPRGWCIIPKTSIILHWNQLTLYSTDFSKDVHKILRGHVARVLSGDASTSIAVTGDHFGHMCIWYVASWTCHHDIKVSHEPCHEVKLCKDERVCVRNTTSLSVYNVTSGKKLYTISIHATAIQWCSFGLIASTSKSVHVYAKGVQVIYFQHTSSALYRGQHDQIWSVSGKQLYQFEINYGIANWPSECIEWIRAPTFPPPCRYWPKRYMDVLAVSATQWIPAVDTWDPPRIWFRHKHLREAIWKAILECELYDMTHAWSFLPKSLQADWYRQCELELVRRMQTFDYCETTVKLLLLTYTELEMLNADQIIKWCWFHHGRLCIRPVLLFFTQNDLDGSVMKIALQSTPSPDFILCFSPASVHIAIENGTFVHIIQWLVDFHEQYPIEPTHHMRQIFTILLAHVYSHLDKDTMDLPLAETGTFQSVQKISLAHRHAYIKVEQRTGYVTEISTSGKTKWCPISTATPIPLEPQNVLVWTYDNKSGPKTMLECALLLLNDDIWSCRTSKKPFHWFSSEVGAFIMHGACVSIFGQTMRIEEASWTSKGGKITTDSNFEVDETESVDIQCVAPLWSYIDENLYHVAPLRVKISHCVSLGTRKINMAATFADELLQCCGSDVIQNEHKWSLKTHATSMAFHEGMFFVGTFEGLVYEYNTLYTVDTAVRTFEGHDSQILKITIHDSRLMSMCEDRMVLWNLSKGTKILAVQSHFTFVSMIKESHSLVWVIETHKDCPIATLWNVHTEVPERRLDTSRF